MMNSLWKTAEVLVREDGQIAEAKLPFDQEQSKLAYETATFGMG